MSMHARQCKETYEWSGAKFQQRPSEWIPRSDIFRGRDNKDNKKLIVGTPGLVYPLLLCLGKSLVVILNYALTAEQPDPCGP